MKKALLLTLLAAGALTACDKEKDEVKAKTKSDILVGKRWRVTSAVATFTLAGQPSTLDLLPFQDACAKDDFLTFKTDKTLITDEGPIRCSPSSPQTQAGSWSLSADELKLTTTLPGTGTQIADLITLTETSLVIEQDRTTSPVGAARVRITSTAF